MLVQRSMVSPVGQLRLVASEDALVGVYFPGHRRAPAVEARAVDHHAVLDHAVGELLAFFRGELRSFSTPLSSAGTPWQEAVWAALRAIPYGERRSYSDLARAVGNPGATRAVGTANGLNRLSIFVPCHRVVAADGSLGGYAGGLAAKRWLLELEGRG